MGNYPIPLKSREKTGPLNGPCITIREADKPRTNVHANLAKAIREGRKEEFMSENNLSNEQVRGICATGLGQPWLVTKQKHRRIGKMMPECAKYAAELYQKGMELAEALRKSEEVFYGGGKK